MTTANSERGHVAPATPCSASWLPIESAPITDHGYFFARIAWGPDHDKSTGDGIRYKGEWFAGAMFYQVGQDRKYALREIKVTPTHWKEHELFLPNESDVPCADARPLNRD